MEVAEFAEVGAVAEGWVVAAREEERAAAETAAGAKVAGLEAVAREISQLRAAVTSAAEAQRRLEAVVDEAERSGALGTPG